MMNYYTATTVFKLGKNTKMHSHFVILSEKRLSMSAISY